MFISSLKANNRLDKQYTYLRNRLYSQLWFDSQKKGRRHDYNLQFNREIHIMCRLFHHIFRWDQLEYCIEDIF